MLHGLLAISDKGLLLGIIHQEFISRKTFKGKTPSRKAEEKRLPINQKESFRWVNCIEKSKELDTGDCEIIHIADREGDIYMNYTKNVLNGRRGFL